jgi:hypothetical protein
MSRSSLLVFVLTLSCVTAAAQKFERLVRSVGLISFTNNETGIPHSGTGTVVAKMVTDSLGYIFIVTNKHVLPARPSINRNIKFAIRNDEDSIKRFTEIQVPIFKDDGSYHGVVGFDPDGNDIAIINIAGILQHRNDLRYLAYGVFSQRHLAIKDSLIANDISIGDDVLFIGYPEWFYNRSNISPIIRSGVIATDPTTDFHFNEMMLKSAADGDDVPKVLKGFLIDAVVRKGSSGSLVCTKPFDVTITNDNAVHFSTGVYVLGIISFSFFKGERTEHVGGVISADQIYRTMEHFHKTKHPQRVN